MLRRRTAQLARAMAWLMVALLLGAWHVDCFCVQSAGEHDHTCVSRAPEPAGHHTEPCPGHHGGEHCAAAPATPAGGGLPDVWLPTQSLSLPEPPASPVLRLVRSSAPVRAGPTLHRLSDRAPPLA